MARETLLVAKEIAENRGFELVHAIVDSVYVWREGATHEDFEQLAKEIEERTGREVVLGSVYATLERLAEKGLVSSDLGESTAERGGRAKRYFRVTPKGLREVRHAQAALKKLWQGLPQLEGGSV